MRTVEEIRRRKISKQAIHLNLLLMGSPGIGKHTFLQNLSNTSDESEIICLDSESITQLDKQEFVFGHSIVKLQNEVGAPIIINATICDIMDQLNNNSTAKKIKDYLEYQFNSFLKDEIKVQRNTEFNGLSDKRLHAGILFIDGNAKGLHNLEVNLLREIYPLINIIIVIAKSDRFNNKEIELIKDRVNEAVYENKITIFNFGDDYLDDIYEETDHVLIKNYQPFAVILGNERDKEKNQFYRSHICSKLYTDNISTSDLFFLKGLLLGSHLQELKYSTNSVIYERFRTRKLLERQSEKVQKPDIFERSSELTTEPSEVSPILLDSQFINPIEFDKNMLFGKELEEKNKIIEAYQKRIGALEKILQNSNDSSPTTKVAMSELERAL